MVNYDVYYDWYQRDGVVMRGFCLSFAIIACILFVLQLVFLQKLVFVPVYLLPLLSFCIAYENIVLFCGESIEKNSNIANSAYFFLSLQVPLFVVVLFEITFHLHEARSAKFCCIPFDQSEDVINDWGLMIKKISLVPLWSVRMIASGLFVMNVLAFYSLVTSEGSERYVGKGGYITLAQHSSMIPLWLALIPPMFLSAMGLYISLVLYRYGINFTISMVYNRRWRYIFPCVLCQLIGQIWDTNAYAVTSNAGELCLLIGTTFILFLVQKDLALAGSFADFLHRSNLAFEHYAQHHKQTTSDGKQPTSTGSGRTSMLPGESKSIEMTARL